MQISVIHSEQIPASYDMGRSPEGISLLAVLYLDGFRPTDTLLGKLLVDLVDPYSGTSASANILAEGMFPDTSGVKDSSVEGLLVELTIFSNNPGQDADRFMDRLVSVARDPYSAARWLKERYYADREE